MAPPQPDMPENNATLTSADLQGFCNQLRSLTITSGYKNMASLLDETTHLHEQVRLKEEELAKLREEMKEKEKKKQEVIHELLGTNKQEACRHERTQRTVDTLRKSVKEKQKLINEMESRANDLQVQINGLQQSLSDKKAGISRAEDEIATLQRAI